MANKSNQPKPGSLEKPSRTVPQKLDLGLDGVDFVIDVSDEYTGNAGLCIRVRGWTQYKDGRYGPTKNGIYIPIAYAPELATAILEHFNFSTNSGLVIMSADEMDLGDEDDPEQE
jgi:hypothetical protein